MCGRFVLKQSEEELMLRYKVPEVPLFKPSYNIAPSQNTPVVFRQSPNSMRLMKWGLIPFWAKDPRIGFKMINARAETVSTAPSYRVPFKKQRCLVPANGFYEWKKEGSVKIPHYIKSKHDTLFSMAGLYDIWKDAEGHETCSYTIITTEPNETMKPIHNRMPVILSEGDEDTWLDIDTKTDTLKMLLKPCGNDVLIEYEVSTEVNNPRNNSVQLLDQKM